LIVQLFVGTALVSAEEIPGDKGDKVLVSSFLQLPINIIIDIAIIGNTFVSFIGFCFSL